uniref:RNA helicase n=1 Tax=Anguilla japonica TaxID=7937 RepID=A0A4Y1JLT4_ANGJA|nr:retinoic acid-inducible protein I [Anguilla japonica]
MTNKDVLRQYQTYITNIIQPSCILPLVDFLTDHEDQIQTVEDQKGLTEAATLMMSLIYDLPETQGWFRMLLNGFSNAGYSTLAEAIESNDFADIEKAAVHKEVVRKLRVMLANQLKPLEILLYMPEVLLPSQRQRVERITELKGKVHGTHTLLDFLLRTDNPRWYTCFLDALRKGGYDQVVNVLDDQNGNASEQSGVDSKEEALEEMEISFSEEAGPSNLFASADAEKDGCQPTLNYDAPSSVALRNYQLELAEPALKGKNTIICAPTGSGKTMVAMEICRHHLEQSTEERGRKVVFLANTIPLCQQQMEMFQKYFENTDFGVTGHFGDDANPIAIRVSVETYEIIVMTPKLLEINLEDGTIPGLSTFTLIFFDECHHTMKNHAYNAIMKMYLDIKLGPEPTPLPQIVGLTASVGVGKSKNERDAREHIYQLCANLDTDTISTVRQNEEELSSHVFVPDKDTRIAKRRVANPFMDIVLELMARVESLANNTYNIDSLSKIPRSTRGSQCYEQWIVEVQRNCKVLRLDNEDEEKKVCRKLVTCAEHLRKYNDCLIISEDARVKDAFKYLQEHFDNLDPEFFDETDEKLVNYFQEKKAKLKNVANDNGTDNPKLSELQLVFEEQYRFKPETRTILFVRTRALAEAIKEWVLETPTLTHLRPKVLIGRRKTDKVEGMSLSNQKAALGAFQEGGSKLLIATSVADEGIDIASCNLVLLYDYVGNVIKMVQTRGRGRAKDSLCILITSNSESATKEQINIIHEKMMYDAIKSIQRIDHTHFLAKVNKMQTIMKKTHDIERQRAQTRSQETDLFVLLCGKCRKLACNSKDIRVIKNSHRVVINKDFIDLCNVTPHPKPKKYDDVEMKRKIACKDCNRDWGIMGSYLGLPELPLLKTEGFIFVNSRTQSRPRVNKWQDFPGVIEEFNILDMSSTAQGEGV